MSRNTLILVFFAVLIVPLSAASACGGLFCQGIPVDQQAERIIFTINADETITAYVQINYTGSAPDFSWVVPVPDVPEVDVAEIESFDELSNLTAPIFMPPLMPECAPIPMMSESAMMEDGVVMEGEVAILASGTAGPYQYEVVTSPDPNELILWLRRNDYRITEEMEPLVRVYTDEGMVFLAMQLQPEQGVQDIQPVAMTYPSTQPMIPIRLTAVAANPNMNVLTWVFADDQVVPANYAHPVIYDSDIRSDFTSVDGTNYLSLVDQTVDLYEGRAMITEYARPTTQLLSAGASDPLVQQLIAEHRYVTRLFGRMSPEEMTVDPTFRVDASRPDVSNIHDLTDADPEIFWNCEGDPVQVEYDPNVVPPGF